jgi:hypothetical protein
MAYVNGRNNGLEDAALCNLYEMLSAESSSLVNLVVEMSLDGRASHADTISAPCDPIGEFSHIIPYWHGTRRFAIKNHKREHKETPFIADLRNPQALEHFVRRTINRFPADHYMVILWDHGEGTPRFQEFLEAKDKHASNGQLSEDNLLPRAEDMKLHDFNDSPAISMYKAGTKHTLLNTQIRAHLEKALKSVKLDVIGFDACYKGMIETAYAMSPVANVMVASEEREPSQGWNYFDWLSTLNKTPDLGPEQLGALLVESYRTSYARLSDLTSQSAVGLTKLTPVLDQLDALSRLLIKRNDLWPVVSSVRKGIHQYQFREIDLTEFVSALEAALKGETSDANLEILTILARLTELLKAFISQPPYASLRSITVHKSQGTAIYFPCSQAAYRADPDFRFYNPDSKDAIPFFRQHDWGRFLKAALPNADTSCESY